ncbi:MAG: hypothetical protein ABI599_06785 [Flavobacteriales bacterium]
MANRKPLTRLYTGMLPMSFMAVLFTACSGSNSNTDPGTTGVIDENHNGTTQDEPDAIPATNSGTNATMDGGQATSSSTTTSDRVVVSNDMRGLRGTLMKELEAVRARLNVGTNPYPERAADQTRAAELAQGLERVDRALTVMDEATDATWADIRDAQKKEVEEVRVWLRKYDSDDRSARKQ